MEIVFFEKPKHELFENAVFITGFQGFGMVGYLASRHIVSELELNKIGFIKTKYMPEVTFYAERTGIAYPFELYYGEVSGKKLVVLLNNATPHKRERAKYAEFVAKWVRSSGFSYAVLLGGLDPAIRESSEEKYRWMPIAGFSVALNAPVLRERFVIGPLALLIMFMNAYSVPGIALFSYTELYRPDPRASAVVVEVISEMLGIPINVKKLLEEATLIEAIEEEGRKLAGTIEGEVSSEKPRYSMHV